MPSKSPASAVFDSGSGNATKIKVLKMHGSLNWYVRTAIKDNVPSKLSSSSSVHCTRRIRLTPDMTYTTKHNLGRKTWYTWPIIVPPIFEKGSFIGKVLSAVWNKSFNAVTTAKSIYVYGYSFPAADQQSEVFFKRAIIANNSDRKVFIVNPDFSSAQRANEILRPAALVTCATVNHLVNLVQI